MADWCIECGEDPVKAGMRAAQERAKDYGVDLTDEGGALETLLTEEEPTMANGAKVVPMNPSETATLEGEVARLRARVAELEKLEKAHAALKTLVGLGMMTAEEAAAKLFGGGS